MNKKLIGLLSLGAVAVIGGLAFVWWGTAPTDSSAPFVSAMHGAADAAAPKPVDEVIIPELSPVALRGKQIFEASCSACHGVNAAGTDQGPPLIHNLYRPGHHGDNAFTAAAASGVMAHHWGFGNMPPIPGGVPETQMRWIVKYIREMQEANGVR